MIKAWMIIFIFWHSPNDMSLEDERYMGKIEVPFSSLAACSKAMKNYATESEELKYDLVCVSGDHRSGRKYDPGAAVN